MIRGGTRRDAENTKGVSDFLCVAALPFMAGDGCLNSSFGGIWKIGRIATALEGGKGAHKGRPHRPIR